MMALDCLDDTRPVRSRRSDPATSHAAATNAERFASTHAARILAALKDGPATAHKIADMTGLTVVQVDRRLPEMARAGLCEVMRDELGGDVVVGGFRVWRAA